MAASTIVFLLALLGLVIYVVNINNTLVTLKNRYLNAFSQIEVQLKRRYDLIPNLVETAKAYMGHERGTLEAVTNARNDAAAILKAMGAKDSAVLRTFMYQGGIIGAVGTAVGLALGYGVCRALMAYPLPLDPKVYFISRLPVAMRTEIFVLVGVFSIAVCLVATIWPALHAAFLRPAEAFRDDR